MTKQEKRIGLLLYLIPVVNIWWFIHWKSPYDYFEQNWCLGLFGCLYITPISLGLLGTLLIIGG